MEYVWSAGGICTNSTAGIAAAAVAVIDVQEFMAE
jgi:hypothetical protein